MSAGDRRPGLSLECRRCHRIGTRGFVPYGSEGWECANDRACSARARRREQPDPREMSLAELDDYLDALVRQGREDSPEFHRAYRIWERNQ